MLKFNINLVLTLTVIVTIMITCCKEVGPVIDFSIPQTNKVVLVEYFTGVQCPNCPTGSAKLQELDSIYAGKLAIVTIHAGFFAYKLSVISKIDFKIDDGIAIHDLLGMTRYPIAGLDRRKFGVDEYEVGMLKWPGLIAHQLTEEPPVSIDLVVEPFDASRKLKVKATVQFSEFFGPDTRITLVITEDSIIDPQILPSGDKDTFYVHNHILRAIITPFDGIPLDIDQNEGSSFEAIYTYDVPPDWREEHLNVIGFIHILEDSLNVIQADVVKVVN